MSNIKELNQKILSLKNTQKVTRTMKLVSISKLRRAQLAHEKALNYITQLTKISSSLLLEDGVTHPLLADNLVNDSILILVFSSDKGLCGGFNNNLFKKMNKELQKLIKKGKNIEIISCGNRAYNFFSKRFNVIENYSNLASKISKDRVYSLTKKVKSLFIQGKYESTYLAYNRFESILKQSPSLEKFLPFSLEKKRDDGDRILEPSLKALINFALPKMIESKIFSVLLENSVGEHAARMTAMDSATNNGENLIRHYSTLKNRVRQANITTELTEIIAGAESLN